MELRKRDRRGITSSTEECKDDDSSGNHGKVVPRWRMFKSSLFDAILDSSSTSSCPEQQNVNQLDNQYEQVRKSLELRYGVEIRHDAVQAAAQILDAINIRDNVGVAQLLEEAASKLREDFNSDSDRKDFDRFMFLFDRAFIESREFSKETDVEISDRPCVKEELEEVKCVLEAFRKHWAAPLEDRITVARVVYLNTLREGIDAALSDVERNGNFDRMAIRDLFDTVSTLLLTVDISFRWRRTVTSDIIAEVATSITGVPRIFFPPPFQLPLELIVQRLSRVLIGIDNQLRTIIKAMSIPKPGTRPMYSFLLLGPPGQGKTTLAEALSKEMFDDRIVKYDVADLTGKDFIKVCACRSLAVKEAHGTSGDLGSWLISNSVILFENIDKADAALAEVIRQILHTGSYVDGIGQRIAFSNVLFLFTSTVALSRHRCPNYRSYFKPPLSGFLKRVREMKNPCCDCNLREQLTEAEMWPGFYDSLDEVIVLPSPSGTECRSIFWILLRNAASLYERKVVVYPTAVMSRNTWRKNLFTIRDEGGHFFKYFIEKNLIPVLCNVEDESVVYIDLLLGSNELSFRTHKLSDKAAVHDCDSFEDSLRNSKIFYQIEKEQTTKIYDLSMIYFGLVEYLESHDGGNCFGVRNGLCKLRDVIDILLDRPNETYPRVQVRPGADIRVDRGKKAKYMSEVEFSKMRCKLLEQLPPVQVVAKPLLRSLDYHGYRIDEPRQQATSFLVLGLRDMGKSFVDRLSEYFVADDGTRMLVDLDLSSCTNPNSFFSSTCRSEPDLLLKEAILMRPCSIIVFYNLESAHQSVFNNIISILDNGFLFDNDGTVLDFRQSVIIIVSDIGNKNIMAMLFGVPNGSLDGFTNKGPIGFRFEILNRVEEILLFNPLVSDPQLQLLQGGHLPMKEGQHLKLTNYEINDALLDLFDKKERGEVSIGRGEKMNLDEDIAYSCVFALRKGLIKFRGTEHGPAPGTSDIVKLQLHQPLQV